MVQSYGRSDGIREPLVRLTKGAGGAAGVQGLRISSMPKISSLSQFSSCSSAGATPRGVDGLGALRSHARQCGVCPPAEPPSPRSWLRDIDAWAEVCRDPYEGMDRSTARFAGNQKMRALLRQSRVLI